MCYREHYVEDTAQQVDSGNGKWDLSLNGGCYSEHYVEDTAQKVDSGIGKCFWSLN